MRSAFATALRAIVSRWSDSGETVSLTLENDTSDDKGLCNEACKRLELIANSFTYDEHPALVQRLLSHIGRTTGMDLEGDPSNEITWPEAFESVCHRLNQSFPGWEGNFRITPEFARLLTMILEQYVQKCNPGLGFAYSMSCYHQSKTAIHQCIGAPTEWSHGLIVPYLKWHEKKLRRALVGLGIKTTTVTGENGPKVKGAFAIFDGEGTMPDNFHKLPDEVIPLVADHVVGDTAPIRLESQREQEEDDSDESDEDDE